MMNDYNSLIKKYTDKLKDDPKSRAFAPLGEIYRKLGLYKQAISVYESGIRIHPTYSLGIIGLAQCYLEIDEYQLSYNVLKPYLNLNNDNLKYLSLFASICERLNFIDEALGTYKNILFLNPKDRKAEEYVSRFEDESLNQVSYRSDELFELDALDTGLNEWSQLNLLDPVEIEVEEKEEVEVVKTVDEKPLFSHTLVDLYIQGGAVDKAIGILESALENNPSDERTAIRLEELRKEVSLEEAKDDHDNLMKIFDEKVSSEDVANEEAQEPQEPQEAKEAKEAKVSEEDIIQKIEMSYSLFLSHIKAKSKEIVI